jgi:hypothetical protein
MNRRVFQNIFIYVASLVLVAALGVFPAFAKDSGSKTFDHVYVIVLENYGFDDALYNGMTVSELSKRAIPWKASK